MAARLSLRRVVLRWHRRIGMAAELFLLVVLTTGIVLQHPQSFGLRHNASHASWLLEWYGLPAVQPPQHFQAGQHWLSLVGESLYIDGEILTNLDANKVRAIYSDGDAIWLKHEEETLRIDSAALAATIFPALPAAAEKLEISTPPAPLAEAMDAVHARNGLPLERILLDLHTGRFFGSTGAWIMDAAAIALLYLTLSGIYNFFHRPRQP